MKYKYWIANCEEATEAAKICESDYHDGDHIAEECAMDYFHNHDGWESVWPLDIIIDGIGVYQVEFRNDPTFKAVMVKNENN